MQIYCWGLMEQGAFKRGVRRQKTLCHSALGWIKLFTFGECYYAECVGVRKLNQELVARRQGERRKKVLCFVIVGHCWLRKIRRRRFINLIVPIGEHEVPQPNEMNASRRSNELLVRKQKYITNVQWTASDLSHSFPGGNAFCYRATPIVIHARVWWWNCYIVLYNSQQRPHIRTLRFPFTGKNISHPQVNGGGVFVVAKSNCCTLVFFSTGARFQCHSHASAYCAERYRWI